MKQLIVRLTYLVIIAGISCGTIQGARLENDYYLWEAVVFDNLKQAQELLKKKANPNSIYSAERILTLGKILKKGINHPTPALHVAISNGSLAMVKLLLRYKADINIKDPGQGFNSAMHVAVRGPNTKILELLLSKGSPINQTNSTGDTPLHVAAQNGLAKAVKLLLEKGADPQIRNAFYDLPLDVAKNKETRDILEKATKK